MGYPSDDTFEATRVRRVPSSKIMTMKMVIILQEIEEERERQEKLREEGRFRYTCATPDGMTSSEKLAVLMEEVGETARAVIEMSGNANDLASC